MVTIKRLPDFKKNSYEEAAWARNGVIAGVDEVGRGCLAGPVVAAAVILKPKKTHPLVKDSKLLDAAELQKAYSWIIKNSWYGTAIINNNLIDKINIYQATLTCMRRAAHQLLATAPRAPELFVVDAMPLVLGNFQGDIIHFIYGEKKSSSIAAASIVAKVTRDAIMQRHDSTFPGYNLARHKGYSTPSHKKILIESPQSLIHRVTFIDHFVDCGQEDTQESLLCL
ncbi:MAG: ribonuclease HII [Candidatus Babeliaceae bacterium]|jgi:ribonuclease HII